MLECPDVLTKQQDYLWARLARVAKKMRAMELKATGIEKVKVNLLTQSGLDWTGKYSATSTAALPTRSRRFRATECWANLADRRGALGK